MSAGTPIQSDCGELDPQIRAFAEAVLAAYERHGTDAPVPLERARAIAEEVRRPWARGGPEMARIEEFRVPTGSHRVRVRLYEPHGAVDGPALIYLHGGGWTLFSLNTHDRLMREYAQRGAMRVLGIDYSLAPEHRFPDQLEECAAVIDWLGDDGGNPWIDPSRVAIGGDSAGANLALCTCLLLRDRSHPLPPVGMLLNYGAFDARALDAPADVTTPTDFTLTHSEMRMFWMNYLRSTRDRDEPLANPAVADLRGLPPACLVIAERDVLLEENLSMARRLKSAGVEVTAKVYPGTTHSFLEAVSVAQVAACALQESADWLRTVLAR